MYSTYHTTRISDSVGLKKWVIKQAASNQLVYVPLVMGGRGLFSSDTNSAGAFSRESAL